MKNLWKRFCHERSGMGTVEIIIIIGVLVAVALLFREQLISFVKSLMAQFFQV